MMTSRPFILRSPVISRNTAPLKKKIYIYFWRLIRLQSSAELSVCHRVAACNREWEGREGWRGWGGGGSQIDFGNF